MEREGRAHLRLYLSLCLSLALSFPFSAKIWCGFLCSFPQFFLWVVGKPIMTGQAGLGQDMVIYKNPPLPLRQQRSCCHGPSARATG